LASALGRQEVGPSEKAAGVWLHIMPHLGKEVMAIAQSVWPGHRFAKERGEESLDTSGLLSCPRLPGQQTEWLGLVPGHEKEKRRDVNMLSKKVTR